MLSTPPAFNLSQNQTLQLKSLLPVPRPLGLNQLNSKLFSRFALHLSKNQRPLPQPLRFRQRRSGNLPRPVQLVNNFFFRTPKFFFGARREDFSPAQKRELIPTPSRCQPLSSAFFKKLVRPAVPASRPCPAQRDIPSRSGENGLCTSTPPLSTTFYFFSDFFAPHSPFLPCFRSG